MITDSGRPHLKATPLSAAAQGPVTRSPPYRLAPTGGSLKRGVGSPFPLHRILEDGKSITAPPKVVNGGNLSSQRIWYGLTDISWQSAPSLVKTARKNQDGCRRPEAAASLRKTPLRKRTTPQEPGGRAGCIVHPEKCPAPHSAAPVRQICVSVATMGTRRSWRPTGTRGCSRRSGHTRMAGP